MGQTEEGWLTLKDGTKLYTKTWKPESTPTALLVFLHGFSDHCNAYYSLFPTLSSPPYSIQISTFDQRGWGHSVHTPSDKGLTGHTDTVLNDIHQFILSVSSTITPTPIFLMGHSMGGAQALHYLLTTSAYLTSTRPAISGLLLEAPFIALDPKSQPFALTVILGKLAAKVAPNRQMLQKLDPKYVSRSPQVQSDWDNDALCHDTGTLQGLAGMLQRAADLVTLSTKTAVPSLTAKVPCPVWLGHGDEDKLTSYAASKKVFDVLEAPEGDKTFKNYEGAYHKLHAEPDGVGEEFERDVGDWIVARAKAASGKGESRQAPQPKL